VKHRANRGFTLVEVLVALVVVALGLTSLMVAVSGTARTSGYLRDKVVAQWIALNRLAAVRLTVNRLGDTHDTGELDFANRKWHYDTRYFDTTVPSMKRIVVRVWAGPAKTKGNPIAESTGFLGSTLSTPGMSNIDWTQGTSATANAGCIPSSGPSTPGASSNGLVAGAPPTSTQTNCVNGTQGTVGTPNTVVPAPTTPTTTTPNTTTP
jgi:general secretion pathway protein I